MFCDLSSENFEKKFTFEANVESVIYFNENNNYTVANVLVSDDNVFLPVFDEVLEYDRDGTKKIHKSIKVVGRAPRLTRGIKYNFVTHLEKNTKYNSIQYAIERCETKKNISDTECQTFLNTIIAPSQASILCSVYPNIVKIITENRDFVPDYSKLKGIKEKTFARIKEAILTNYKMSDFLTLLAPLGITLNSIKKLFHYENGGIDLLKEQFEKDPYKLTEIDGFGFKKVDDLALKINPSFINSSQRCVGAIKYIFDQVANNEGHTWITKDMLITEVKKLVPQCRESFNKIYFDEWERCKDGTNLFLKISNDGSKIGLNKFYNIEKSIFDKLCDLESQDNEYKDINFEEEITKVNEKLGFDLTPEQEEFVKSVATHNVCVLNGYSGTGKSSSIKGVLEVYKDKRIAICALSAKAARRVVELTHYSNCQTIHRLLCFKDGRFTKDEESPLDYDIVICDEVGMVSVSIMNSLLKALPKKCKFIAVGDSGQLAPIGAGNFLNDILESRFYNVTLSKIMRQAARSGIISDGNLIRQGISPIEEFSLKTTRGELQDMFYAFRANKEDIQDTIINTYRYLHSQRHIPAEEIVVLLPMKNGVNATKTINTILQDELLPNEKISIAYGEKIFKLGTRIIQRVNDYDKNIVNGETGSVKTIWNFNGNVKNKDYDFECVFPDYTEGGVKTIPFKKSEMSTMDLSYALTVHLAQGSSYPYVIVGLDTSHTIMLDSTLLYTAITRASKECYCIAQPEAFVRAVSNSKVKYRQTYLGDICSSERILYNGK